MSGDGLTRLPFNLGTDTANVGVSFGDSTPGSKLSVQGNLAIGGGYQTLAAPANGAIIQGSVGIGTASPQSQLEVAGYHTHAANLYGRTH